jgi:hypothetical protein
VSDCAEKKKKKKKKKVRKLIVDERREKKRKNEKTCVCVSIYFIARSKYLSVLFCYRMVRVGRGDDNYDFDYYYFTHTRFKPDSTRLIPLSVDHKETNFLLVGRHS